MDFDHRLEFKYGEGDPAVLSQNSKLHEQENHVIEVVIRRGEMKGIGFVIDMDIYRNSPE